MLAFLLNRSEYINNLKSEKWVNPTVAKYTPKFSAPMTPEKVLLALYKQD